jgi:mannose-1-phosphate guanylyltransferase
LRPLTVTTAKPMLPVAGVPFLTHQLTRLRDAGVDHVVLATSYEPDAFAAYFGDGADLGIALDYVTEETALGTGGGISNVAPMLRATGDEPVIVLNGDVVSAHDIGAQLADHRRVDAAVTLHLTVVDDARAFGCVPTDDEGAVLAFHEKMPEPVSDQVNAGCYVFRRSIIDTIPTGRPVSVERETFPALLDAGERLQGYVEGAYWIDVGTPAAYVQASCDLVRGRAPGALPGPVGERLVLDGATVDSGAVVDGGSTIGHGAVVASDAVVRGSVVHDDVSIEPGARVISSVIGRGSRIGRETVVEDAVLGDGVEVGAGNELRAGIRLWPKTVIADRTVRFSSDE